MNKVLSIVVFSLILSRLFLAPSLEAKETFYSLPITSNPEEERIFVLNQLAHKINNTLNEKGVGSILLNKNNLNKYIQHGKKLSHRSLNQSSKAIYKNIILIENLLSLKPIQGEFNIEKSLKSISIETNNIKEQFNRLHISENNPSKISHSQFKKDLNELININQNISKKLNELRENPDQLYLSAIYGLKSLNSFYNKYKNPFYISVKNKLSPTKLKLSQIISLKKELSFYKDFLNPKKKNKYIDVISQDLSEIKVGHATESTQGFFSSLKEKKKRTKLKNIKLGKSKKLELVNKDKNI